MASRIASSCCRTRARDLAETVARQSGALLELVAGRRALGPRHVVQRVELRVLLAQLVGDVLDERGAQRHARAGCCQ